MHERAFTQIVHNSPGLHLASRIHMQPSVCSWSPFIKIGVGNGFTFFVHHRFFCVRIVSVKVDHKLVIGPDQSSIQEVTSRATRSRTHRQLARTRAGACKDAVLCRWTMRTSERRTCLRCLHGTPRPPSAGRRSHRTPATHDLDPSSHSYVESPRTTLSRQAQTDSLRKQHGIHGFFLLRPATTQSERLRTSELRSYDLACPILV